MLNILASVPLTGFRGGSRTEQFAETANFACTSRALGYFAKCLSHYSYSYRVVGVLFH